MTGEGNSGAVKRWNLEGEEGTSRESKNNVESQKRRRKSRKTAASKGTSGSDGSSGTSAVSTSGAGKATFKNSGRFVDFYFQSLIEGQEEGQSLSSPSGAGASTGTGGGSVGKTSRSPTVEKAASAMRGEAKAKEKEKSEDEEEEEEKEEEEEGVVSVSSAQALGSVMNERQRVYASEDQQSPVVSVQADESKLVACYEDGNIKAWDVQSMANLFDLQGRTSLISCCQFDASRLIADGTHHILVTHDFSDSPNQEDNGQNNTFTYDGSADDGSSEGKPTTRDEP